MAASSGDDSRIFEITSFLSSRCPSFKKLSEANALGVAQLLYKDFLSINTSSNKLPISVSIALDDARLLIHCYCSFATSSKTTQPSVFLACIAESALLSKRNDTIDLAGSHAEYLRNLYIQCFHGAAPEEVRDRALSSVLTLFSCRNHINLMWTLDKSSKSDRNIPDPSSNSNKSGSDDNKSDSKDSNFFNNPANNRGLQSNPRSTSDNFIKLFVNMVASELHVTIEELLFYLVHPISGDRKRNDSVKDDAKGGSESKDAIAKDVARLNRCERALYLLLLATEYTVQFLIGDEDDDGNEDDDDDDGGIVIDEAGMANNKAFVDSDDEIDQKDDAFVGRGGLSNHDESSLRKTGGSSGGKAVDWTSVSFEVVESIQQSLHSIANDIFEFVEQYSSRAKQKKTLLDARYFSENRLNRLLRRLMSVISFLAEEDEVIYKRFNSSIPSILSFSTLMDHFESHSIPADLDSIDPASSLNIVYSLFGFTSSASSSKYTSSESKNDSAHIFKSPVGWDESGSATASTSSSSSSSDDIIDYYIIDIAEDAVNGTSYQCDMLYTVFPLLYRYLVVEDYGIEPSLKAIYTSISVNLLNTLTYLLLFNSKGYKASNLNRDNVSGVIKLSTQMSIQILELLPKLLFNGIGTNGSTLKASMWISVDVAIREAITAKVHSIIRFWRSNTSFVDGPGDSEYVEDVLELLEHYQGLCHSI